ncbi:MAG: ATP-binding protein [Planctomycetota bacterium]
MSPKETIEVVPSAKRLVHSLRDIGYDLNHAVADLVDNSIAAKAGRVDITFCFDGEDSWIRVSDDGLGMSGPAITEAMRFGSERDYEVTDLGKFGLGLKTASLSQCCRLSVASRASKTTRRIEARQWDLDHISRKNTWSVFNLGAGERSDSLVGPLQEATGTVILWEKLDRVLSYKVPWGNKAKTGLLQAAEGLDLHLGMVFHRFLTGEARRRKKLRMFLNGTPIEPWDPFARAEPKTKEAWGDELEVQTDSGRGVVRCSAYILPRKDDFSSDRAFQRHSGPAKWNRQQGFYIYRGDRMIQSGGWCRMRTADEHTKLARIALDFQPDLDEAFSINVTKARVGLPRSLREQLSPHIDRVVKRAREVYDSKPRRPRPTGGSTDGKGSGTSNASVAATSTSKDHGTGASATTNSTDHRDQHVTPRHIGSVLREAARRSGTAEAMKSVAAEVRQSHPEVFDALGW